jgi:hypothetical protein
MPLYDQSLPNSQWTSVNAGVIPEDVFGVAINWFVNRTPLTTRLPRGPVGSASFRITNDNYRPRSVPLGTSATSGQGTLVFTDASSFTVGDVVQADSELMLVTAATATTLTVTNAYAGTSAAAHTAPVPVYLITNTRTGAEIDVTGISRVPVTIIQPCQTVQHAYQVGGALQADDNYYGGFITPLARDKMLAVQHVMDDFESACYYGKGVALAAAGTRPLMKGFDTLLTTNIIGPGHATTAPTNATAYKPSDLVRDTMQACFQSGGNPNLMLMSTDFMTGMAVWGHAAQRLQAGANVFGTPIDLFEAPFLSGISIIPAPLLRAGTVICLSGPEVRLRMKRDMIDKPRGSRGDAFEGDVIMEGAIEIANEAHHSMVSGITGFAAA